MLAFRWEVAIPVAVGAVVGAAAFVPPLLSIASARSRESRASVAMGFVALGVSFVVLMASTLFAFATLERDAIFFVFGLVGGFLGMLGFVAAKVALEK